jgi:hypothetical protein
VCAWRRLALGVPLVAGATLLLAGCGGHADYPFHDVDHGAQARTALPGCAADLDSWHAPVRALHANADIDADGRPDRVSFALTVVARCRRTTPNDRGATAGVRPAFPR